MESADVIIVNKGDGDLIRSAKRAQFEYMSAVRLLTPKYEFWAPSVLRCSSVTHEGKFSGVFKLNQQGLDKVWDVASRFMYLLKKHEKFESKRAKQFETWMWNIIYEQLEERYKRKEMEGMTLSDLKTIPECKSNFPK
jgi:LAO/AO transport system kinase